MACRSARNGPCDTGGYWSGFKEHETISSSSCPPLRKIQPGLWQSEPAVDTTSNKLHVSIFRHLDNLYQKDLWIFFSTPAMWLSGFLNLDRVRQAASGERLYRIRTVCDYRHNIILRTRSLLKIFHTGSKSWCFYLYSLKCLQHLTAWDARFHQWKSILLHVFAIKIEFFPLLTIFQ